MSNMLYLLASPVNIRAAPSLHAAILATGAENDTGTVTNIRPDADGDRDPATNKVYQWLNVHLSNADGTERIGWLRADLPSCTGDFRLFGGGLYLGAYVNLQAQLGTASGTPTSPATPPSGRWASPVQPYTITKDYHGDTGGHKGIDLAGATGSIVTAATDGTVVQAVRCTKCVQGDGSLAAQGITDPSSTFNDVRYGYGFGNFVVVRYPWQGRNLFALYGHLATIAVTEGAWPTPGSTLGTRGSTGNSSGSHLHIECHVSDSAQPVNIFNEPLVNPHEVFAL